MSQVDRLVALRDAHPARTALVVAGTDGREVTLTMAELVERVEAAAGELSSRGVGPSSLVAIAIPNGVAHVVACHAAWWLGACVMPLSPHLPEWEFGQVIRAASESGRDVLVVGENRVESSSLHVSFAEPGSLVDPGVLAHRVPPPARVIPEPGVAIPSGGSTGRPKIIVDSRPMIAVPGVESATSRLLGHAAHHRVLVVGPLYHTGPFGSLRRSLFERGFTVLMERFDPGLALELIERHRINRLFSVPAQLLRMARDTSVNERDLSSIEVLYHSGAVCPPWLKRFWIDRLGPERVVEGYGSTEAIGALAIRGDEWLLHPGSVGRPEVSEVKIRDEHGAEVPVGEVGELYMRWRRTSHSVGDIEGSAYRYWGSDPASSDDEGFTSVGDLARLDEDGYVYIVDRRVDMIVSGGANIYPAEIEGVLSEHEAVADIAVVGVPDETWGKRVHAIIESPTADAGLVDELDQWCRARLGPTKVPKSYEFVSSLPRNAAGKLRRKDLAEERLTEGDWRSKTFWPQRPAVG